MENNIIEKFKFLIETVSSLYPDGDVEFFITDTERFVANKVIKLDLNSFIKIGSLFSPEGSVAKCIKEKKTVNIEVPASIYGVALKVVTTPIFDDTGKNIVGTYGMATLRDNAETLRSITKTYEEGMSQMAIATNEIAIEAENIAKREKDQNIRLDEIKKLIKEISQISDVIKTIADQTKMLGLNAAIEAARSGEAGRGFAVVAEEIRKLSTSSKDTVKKTFDVIALIQKDLKEIISNSELSLASVEVQAASVEEIAASIQEFQVVAQKLNKIANLI